MPNRTHQSFFYARDTRHEDLTGEVLVNWSYYYTELSEIAHGHLDRRLLELALFKRMGVK